MFNIAVLTECRLHLEGLCALIENEKDMNIVGKSDSLVNFFSDLKELNADVAVVCIEWVSSEFLSIAEELSKSGCGSKLILVSHTWGERMARLCREKGIAGLVSARSGFLGLCGAIRDVADGLLFFDQIEEGKGNSNADQLSLECLSEREIDVLRLLTMGMTTKEIAFEFNRSPETVEAHRVNIMKKLNVYSIAQLTKIAVRKGIVGLNPCSFISLAYLLTDLQYLPH